MKASPSPASESTIRFWTSAPMFILYDSNVVGCTRLPTQSLALKSGMCWKVLQDITTGSRICKWRVKSKPYKEPKVTLRLPVFVGTTALQPRFLRCNRTSRVPQQFAKRKAKAQNHSESSCSAALPLSNKYLCLH